MCVFQKKLFCRKNEKYYVNCPCKKTLDKNLCFYAYGEDQKKEPKNSDEHIAKNVRNVGKNNLMRKLALSDEILLKISQPARYIGGEVNMVKKDPSKVAVRFAMCFPDVFAK